MGVVNTESMQARRSIYVTLEMDHERDRPASVDGEERWTSNLFYFMRVFLSFFN